MAHLIRPWIVRYLDKQGKRVQKGTKGARKVKERARKWYGKGVPGLPPKKAVPLASDKTAAQQMLAELVKRAERGEAGIGGAEVEQSKRPLSEHLADFEATLQAKDVDPKHVKLTMQRLRSVIDGCGFSYPRDIALDRVLSYLAGRRQLSRKDGGLSVQSSNYYLGAMKHFCRWLARTRPRRLAENPLAEAKPGDVRLDRKHDRRELTASELVRVLEAASKSSRTFRGLTGTERHFLYLTACGTGFRANELASLTAEAFDLDAEPPTITLGGRFTKNHKPARQPLPLSVAEDLKGFMKGKRAGLPVWPGNWLEKAAKMLRVDLEAAGVSYQIEGPDGPLFADFHALRHTYITLLEQAGVSPKKAKELARHGDINLTLGRYTHASLADLGEAVQTLGLPGEGHGANPLAALPRAELEALVVGLASLVGALVAPRVAPIIEMQATHGETSGDEKVEVETLSKSVSA